MFSKDNDLIKRIMNLILVIWIIVAVVILYNSAINLLMDNYQYTYDEYQIKYCNKDLEEKDNCQRNYESHLLSQKEKKHSQKKILINSSGNMVIVGTFIYILNRKKEM